MMHELTFLSAISALHNMPTRQIVATVGLGGLVFSMNQVKLCGHSVSIVVTWLFLGSIAAGGEHLTGPLGQLQEPHS